MPRIIVDCTHTFQTGAGTGIQRIVRRFADSLLAVSPSMGIEVVPVRVAGSELLKLPVVDGAVAFRRASSIRELRSSARSAHRLESAHLWGLRANRLLRSKALARWLSAGPNEASLARMLARVSPDEVEGDRVGLSRGDIFLALDSSWVYDIRTILERAGRAGVTRVACLCDVLPLTNPEWFTAGTVGYFSGWVRAFTPRVEALVAISRATCDSLRDQMDRGRLGALRAPSCTVIPLGSEVGEAAEGEVRADLRDSFAPGRPPAFLTVGTLEPRKNVDFALDLFEELLARGLDFEWHLVGAPGWLSEGTARRIRSHRLYGERLHWWTGLTDPELAFCYRHASALVAVSKAEGFGLPLVEARLKGLAVYASDIPVFHEVLGREGRYLPLASVRLSAAALEDFLLRFADGHERGQTSLVAKSWDECARSLAQTLLRIDAEHRGGTSPA